MGLIKDIWRVGVVRVDPEALLAPGALARHPIAWMPDEGPLRFIADPFPVWRDGQLYVFVEAYDYRDRLGRIEVLTLDADLQVIERQPALTEPWHLSYPFIVEDGGETYMLPEAHKSGALTLYRAEAFPVGWRPAVRFELDPTPIDATPVFHEGLWWLFYTPAGTRAEKVSALHLAYAERLTGPWRTHPGNPVRLDSTSARPGGPAIRSGGDLILPMQDCHATYGGAIRPLRVHRLTPDSFEAEAGPVIAPPPAFAPYRAGLHTLAGAGGVTLLDAKRQVVTPRSLALDAAREAGKLRRRAARAAG